MPQRSLVTVDLAPHRGRRRAASEQDAARWSQVPTPVEARQVWRRLGRATVLRGVDLVAGPGDIHVLIGPNGAGKTTLLRLLAGLGSADGGTVSVLGGDPSHRRIRRSIGWMPSGDRSFYLRISGLENLLFFARLHGLQRPQALERARRLLADLDLEHASHLPVNAYSHGMQKRLSLARALLVDPPVLLMDEADHDLDPLAGDRVRELVAAAAGSGTTVVWATQRLEELRGFATAVTVLADGEVRFLGSVDEFLSRATPRRFALRTAPPVTCARLQSALGPLGEVHEETVGAPGGHVVHLAPEATIGRALAALTARGVEVVGCREERSVFDDAFVAVTRRQR